MTYSRSPGRVGRRTASDKVPLLQETDVGDLTGTRLGTGPVQNGWPTNELRLEG